MESKYYHLTGGTHSFLVLHDLLNPSEEFPIHTQSDWELSTLSEVAAHSLSATNRNLSRKMKSF